MDARLLEVCMSGNVQALRALVEKEPLILDTAVTCCDHTPLHVAVLRRHLDLVTALLVLQPELASERDASGCVPLHLASAKGGVEIVRELLRADAELCGARDRGGRTPLHLAVMKGRLEVVRELIRARPESAERLDRGETVFHLAIKYCRLDVIKLLVEELKDDDRRKLLAATDDGGNTVLHFAELFEQNETVRYLVSLEEVEAIANQPNNVDRTAKSPRDMDSFETEVALTPATQAGIRGGRIARQYSTLTTTHSTNKYTRIWLETKRLYHRAQYYFSKTDMDFILDAHGSLMVVATVIASIAYQAGMNPPGGVWQADTTNSQSHACTKPDSCRAGTAVFKDAEWFDTFYTSNTRAMVAALVVVLLYYGGFPLKNKVGTWAMTLLTCLMLNNIMWAYLSSTAMIVNPDRENQTMRYACGVWSAMLLMMAAIYTVRIVYWLTIVKLKQFLIPKSKSAQSMIIVVCLVANVVGIFAAYRIIDRISSFTVFS